MRPGEKLFEELETADEHMTKTRHPKIFIGKIANVPEEKVRHALHWLAALSKNGQEDELRRFLSQIIPEAQLDQPFSENACLPQGVLHSMVGSTP
jgi:FlaA1/EpsC-like NDP-sugar epimerase